MKSNSNIVRTSPKFIPRVAVVSFMVILGVGSTMSQVTEAWVARYDAGDNEHGSVVVVGGNGDVYVTGGTTGGAASDYITIKYNSAGLQQWAQRYNGPGNAVDVPLAMCVDDSGNVYVTGESDGGGSGFDFATIKYDISGTQRWVQRYSGLVSNVFSEQGTSIAVDDSGNVYVAGHVWVEDPIRTPDYATIKYNSEGVQQWVQKYDGGTPNVLDQDYALRVAVDNNGNVYVTGVTTADSTFIATIKYSSSGAQQWVRRSDGPTGYDYANDMVLDNDGNIIVVGYRGSIVSGVADCLTIKYNPAGAQQWIALYDGPGHLSDYAVSVGVDGKNNVYITGNSGDNGSSCTTIKYNPSGVQQWVQRYVYPSGIASASSIAVDNDGNSVVTGSSKGIGLNRDYVTVMYDSSGVQQWVRLYDGPPSGHDIANSVAVDNNGNAYVTGQSDGGGTGNDIVTIKYSRALMITSPQAGERWIAGDQDTIRWTGGQAGQFLEIELSVDSGANYTSIDSGIPADSGMYVWTVPDSLSTRAKIRLSDFFTSDPVAESDTFRIKGYVLTRMNAIGHYEAFEPTKDGWSFENSSAPPVPLWPSTWWQQFDYIFGNDPNTGQRYSTAFLYLGAMSNRFPDWPAYVRVFGRDSCFFPGTNTDRPKAFNNWKHNSDSWSGSCFGIALTSLWAFHYKPDFLSSHPGIPSFDSLFAISTMNDSIRLAITMAYSEQFGQLKRGHDRLNLSTTPRMTLQWIRQMFSNDDPDDDAGLRLVDPGGTGGHAVVPYKLSRDMADPGQFRLYVCNSNNPSSFNDYILIDSLANTWKEFAGLGWGAGTTRMYPHPPAKLFFPRQYISFAPALNGIIDAPAQIPRLAFHASSRMNVSVVAETGDSLGYANGHAFSSGPDAFPVILDTGHPQPPVGYDVPAGTYRVRADGFTDSLMYITVSMEAADFSYFRADATSQERDDLRFDGGLHVRNGDPSLKQCSLSTLLTGHTEDKTFDVALGLSQHDSVAIQKHALDGMKLENGGNAKEYALSLRLSSSAGSFRFERPSLQIPTNSSHHISPQWDDLSTVRILQDIGNDGTIDDTLIVDNLVGVDEHGRREVPTEYNLAQNYPNPFNPTTRIDYELPRPSHVVLTVYNVLGQLMATLVDEERPAGRFTVEWNGATNTGSRVSSGVYLYRLEARSGQSLFSSVKKMILTK